MNRISKKIFLGILVSCTANLISCSKDNEDPIDDPNCGELDYYIEYVLGEIMINDLPVYQLIQGTSSTWDNPNSSILTVGSLYGNAEPLLNKLNKAQDLVVEIYPQPSAEDYNGGNPLDYEVKVFETKEQSNIYGHFFWTSPKKDKPTMERNVPISDFDIYPVAEGFTYHEGNDIEIEPFDGEKLIIHLPYDPDILQQCIRIKQSRISNSGDLILTWCADFYIKRFNERWTGETPESLGITRDKNWMTWYQKYQPLLEKANNRNSK